MQTSTRRGIAPRRSDRALDHRHDTGIVLRELAIVVGAAVADQRSTVERGRRDRARSGRIEVRAVQPSARQSVEPGDRAVAEASARAIAANGGSRCARPREALPTAPVDEAAILGTLTRRARGARNGGGGTENGAAARCHRLAGLALWARDNLDRARAAHWSRSAGDVVGAESRVSTELDLVTRRPFRASVDADLADAARRERGALSEARGLRRDDEGCRADAEKERAESFV